MTNALTQIRGAALLQTIESGSLSNAARAIGSRRAIERPDGNVDADHRQEAGKGSDCEEDGVEAAAQVGLATPKDSGPTFFQTAKGVLKRQPSDPYQGLGLFARLNPPAV